IRQPRIWQLYMPAKPAPTMTASNGQSAPAWSADCDMLSPRFSPVSPGIWGYVASVGNLIRRHSVGNTGSAAERLITEGRLPVQGDDELGTIKKLGFRQKRPRQDWRRRAPP